MTPEVQKLMARLLREMKASSRAVFIVTWDKNPEPEAMEILCSETNNPETIREMFQQLILMVNGDGADRPN